jgi:hypothetical protein
MSPPCALQSLLRLEGERIPRMLWEPSVGDGTGMAIPLREAGYIVETSDIADYGFPRTWDGNILDGKFPPDPPLGSSRQRCSTCDILRGCCGQIFLRAPAGSHSSARTLQHEFGSVRGRLPMMHRHGWEGPRAPSNTAYAWFVWDADAAEKRRLGWFDWRQL